MAFVLSLPSSNPLQRPFVEPRYMQSCSSVASQLSSGTIRRTYPRSISPTSVRSISSLPRASWPLPDDQPLPRFASRSVLNFIHDFDIPAIQVVPEIEDTTDSNLTLTSPCVQPGSDEIKSKTQDEIEVEGSLNGVVPFPPLDVTYRGLKDSAVEMEPELPPLPEDDDTEDGIEPPSDPTSTPSPFKRWLSTLRRRRPALRPALRDTKPWPNTMSSPRTMSTTAASHHKSMSLSSSLGMITAVKSASMTLAGTSIAPRGHHHGHFYSDTSGTYLEPRMSMDSTSGSVEPHIDEKAWYRSVQRRNIVEEILSSEESYISDMKAMMHVYFTLLASGPTMYPRRRDSIQRSVSQIIQLHEELLAELYKVVPTSGSGHGHLSPQNSVRRSKHTRWHSVETALLRPRTTILRRRLRHSVDLSHSQEQSARSLVVTTNTVLDVAKVFHRFMRRFLTYEAYVAHNGIMNDEASSTSRLIPAWDSYERGVEALAASTTALDQRDFQARKGLTLGDLGIKPVQRICKYPLFFTDFCKQTPACDDPVVHAELTKVLSRLQETAEEINNARDNPKTRRLIETTWILQDRLTYCNELELSKATLLRLLGHVVLCGALHVAYEASDRVKGQYMICILYRSWFVLATMGSHPGVYLIDTVIPIFHASIEAPDNGRGLQCHTAAHTWKLVFQYRQRYHEFLMSACSELEEEQWKSHIQARITAEARDVAENRPNTLESLSYNRLEMKALGPAFEAHSGMTRRLSIRRAATLGPKTNLRQVIIKNTHSQKTGENESDDPTLVARSKSHMASSVMPTLAPRRAERVRLEGLLCDVWSRETLPFPGMMMRRTENLVKASANSVMRKLSMASIASNFSKRSASFNGLNGNNSYRPDELRTPSQRAFYHTSSRSRKMEKRRSTRAVTTRVDFHTAPSAFLPEDFELKKPSLTQRRQKLVRAMTMETPKTPPVFTIPSTRVLPGQNQSAPETQIPYIQEPSVQHKSEDSGYSSVDRPRAASSMQVRPTQESSSPHPSSLSAAKGPVKAKSLLFKLLGVNKD